MKKFFLILFCIPLFVNAQDKTKYMEGAVPEVDGKVVFSKTIQAVNPVSEADLFNLMDKWARENYKDEGNGLNNRLLLSDAEDKDIACSGDMYLTFKKSFLSLDQARMSYQLIISVEGNKCDVNVRNIRYQYSDFKTPEAAEDLITDAIAINKKKDRLNRYYDKFRIFTVDSINSIFNSIDMYLNGRTTSGAVAQQMPSQPQYVHQQNVPQPVVAGSLPGFKKVSADKIPASLQGGKSLIMTGKTDKASVVKAIWKGSTTLMDKLVALNSADSSKKTAEIMETADTYTVSFFTEIYADALTDIDGGNVKEKADKAGLSIIQTPSGAPAFSEAWMIIECKKAGSMPATEPNGSSDKTYLGEILNVWIK